MTVTLASAIEESQQSSTLVQIKEEEEEEDTNKQPAIKRTRGQPKSQTKYKGSPKDDPKTEGNFDLLDTCCLCNTCNQCDMGWQMHLLRKIQDVLYSSPPGN